MPVDLNLILTLLLWVFALLVYLSDRGSSINRWCAASLVIFSTGGFKEYFDCSLAPALIAKGVPLLNASSAEALYSVMTAVLYGLAMPALLVFALCFHSFSRSRPMALRWTKRLFAVPCVCLLLCFPPALTGQLRLTSRGYWWVVAIYNLLFGIAATVTLLSAVRAEKSPDARRQKTRVLIFVLPPVWYFLSTVFFVRLLQLKQCDTLWIGILPILAVLLIFYICMAFRGGMMGLKLNVEHHSGCFEQDSASQNASFTNHMLKNELCKIKWCASNLRDELSPDTPQEVEIIADSAEHLTDFINKTPLLSDRIVLNKRWCSARNLIEKSVRSFPAGRAPIVVECGETELLFCDPTYTAEALNNLLYNADDALRLSPGGVITVCFETKSHRNYRVLSVADTGCGMTAREKRQIFHPYHTTKLTGTHFGLGLSYCNSVMQKHGGFIRVTSSAGKGSAFSLYFPHNKSLCAKWLEKHAGEDPPKSSYKKASQKL